MRLPKRSAFARPRAELTHLYSLFYPVNVIDPAQADAARRRGVELVHRIYLARSSSPCPVAIECTASLVDALLLDSALSHHPSSSSGNAIRSALSLALIRLVNSLADSLQQGVYAKSIASIAERQLGLPQSFVEFRHRATHEDLPSLAVCREAAGAALSWLQVNYWIPSLQALDAERHLQNTSGVATPSRPATSKPGPSAAESRAAAVASLEPILDSYRRLAKAIARDQSLRSRNRATLEEIAGELEAWKRRTEAALPGRRWAGQDEDSGSEDDDEDDEGSDEEGGRWHASRRHRSAATAASTLTAADDILLLSLLKPGIGIVPLAKSKRPRRDLALSEDIKQTWEYLFERRPELRGQLAQRLADVLAMAGIAGEGEQDDDEQSVQALLSTDASYARTLQAWLLHLVPPDQESEAPVVDQLLQSLLSNDASLAKPQEKKASPALPVLYAFLERRKKRGEDVAQLEELLELAERRQRDGRAEEMGQEEPLLKGFEDMGSNIVAAPPPPPEADQTQREEAEDLDSLFARMERRQLAFGGPVAPAVPPQHQQKVQPMDEEMHVDEGGDEATEEEAAVADIPSQVTALPQGWTLYDEAEWKPTPIGCLAGRVPDFLRLEISQQHAQHISS